MKNEGNTDRSERFDRNGTLITKGRSRKHKVSFADSISQDQNKRIADVIIVQSFKKFNLDNTYGSRKRCCNIM